MYGGTSIVSSFINLNLIDEYHLFVNPALLGGGIPLFQTTNERLNLKLVTAIPTACGIVILHYQPVK
jgi:dihydrofolate reductase